MSTGISPPPCAPPRPGVRGPVSAGLLLIALGELGCLTGWRWLGVWVTPLCWWGLILVLDGWLTAREGVSPLRSRPAVFLRDAALSIVFWLLFEVYNLHLANWRYEGLPDWLPLRLFGFALAFASVGPGMLLTARLIGSYGVFARFQGPRFRFSQGGLLAMMAVGALFLIVPLLAPVDVARWLFALVWLGFIFVLEPVLLRSGAESLLRDLEEGRLERLFTLLLAGTLCGLLWEFWNFWAASRWVYTVPYTPGLQVFEMPLAGLLGFGPFAVEYFVFYATIPLFGRRAGAPSSLMPPPHDRS
jgi:hypothetical protein